MNPHDYDLRTFNPGEEPRITSVLIALMIAREHRYIVQKCKLLYHRKDFDPETVRMTNSRKKDFTAYCLNEFEFDILLEDMHTHVDIDISPHTFSSIASLGPEGMKSYTDELLAYFKIKNTKTHHVYVIKRGETYFIKSCGSIVSIRSLISEFQAPSASLFLTIASLNAQLVEQSLHREFSAERLNTGWFELKPEQIARVRELSENPASFNYFKSDFLTGESFV